MIALNRRNIYFGPNPYFTCPVVVLHLHTTNLNVSAETLNSLIEHLIEISEAKWKIQTQINQKDPIEAMFNVALDWISYYLSLQKGKKPLFSAMCDASGAIIWMTFYDPSLTSYAIEISIALMMKVINHELIDQQILKQKLDRLVEQTLRKHPDFQAEILMRAAQEKSIPYFKLLAPEQIWQFGWGAKSLKFFESSSQEDSRLGGQISSNKVSTKLFLHKLNLPIAPHYLAVDESNLEHAVDKIGYPCVVKPIDNGSARGVTINIQTASELRDAFLYARKFSRQPLMVERFIPGVIHRLLVVRGKLIAATARIPATVIGDGSHSVLTLTEKYNQQRISAQIHSKHLGIVPHDARFVHVLKKQGLTPDSIPENGRHILLYDIPLQSSGAQNIDVLAKVSQDTVQAVEWLAASLSLEMVGVDFISRDITQSFTQEGVFLEINLTPSLRGHLVENEDVDRIAEKVLGNVPSRIPSLLLVMASDDIAKFFDQLKSFMGIRTGWLIQTTLGIGKINLATFTDQYVPASVMESLLINRQTEKLVVVLPPEKIMAYGLPLDRFDKTVLCTIVSDTWLKVLTENSGDMIFLRDKVTYSLNTIKEWCVDQDL